jgi:hypothetical protein
LVPRCRHNGSDSRFYPGVAALILNHGQPGNNSNGRNTVTARTVIKSPKHLQQLELQAAAVVVL